MKPYYMPTTSSSTEDFTSNYHSRATKDDLPQSGMYTSYRRLEEDCVSLQVLLARERDVANTRGLLVQTQSERIRQLTEELEGRNKSRSNFTSTKEHEAIQCSLGDEALRIERERCVQTQSHLSRCLSATRQELLMAQKATSELESSKAQLEKEKLAAEELVEEYRQRVLELEGELNTLEQQHRVLSGDCDELRLLKQMRAECEATIAQLRHEKEELQNELNLSKLCEGKASQYAISLEASKVVKEKSLKLRVNKLEDELNRTRVELQHVNALREDERNGSSRVIAEKTKELEVVEKGLLDELKVRELDEEKLLSRVSELQAEVALLAERGEAAMEERRKLEERELQVEALQRECGVKDAKISVLLNELDELREGRKIKEAKDKHLYEETLQQTTATLVDERQQLVERLRMENQQVIEAIEEDRRATIAAVEAERVRELMEMGEIMKNTIQQLEEERDAVVTKAQQEAEMKVKIVMKEREEDAQRVAADNETTMVRLKRELEDNLTDVKREAEAAARAMQLQFEENKRQLELEFECRLREETDSRVLELSEKLAQTQEEVERLHAASSAMSMDEALEHERRELRELEMRLSEVVAERACLETTVAALRKEMSQVKFGLKTEMQERLLEQQKRFESEKVGYIQALEKARSISSSSFSTIESAGASSSHTDNGSITEASLESNKPSISPPALGLFAAARPPPPPPGSLFASLALSRGQVSEEGKEQTTAFVSCCPTPESWSVERGSRVVHDPNDVLPRQRGQELFSSDADDDDGNPEGEQKKEEEDKKEKEEEEDEEPDDIGLSQSSYTTTTGPDNEHCSNPALAAALRDFEFVSSQETDVAKEDEVSPPHLVISDDDEPTVKAESKRKSSKKTPLFSSDSSAPEVRSRSPSPSPSSSSDDFTQEDIAAARVTMRSSSPKPPAASSRRKGAAVPPSPSKRRGGRVAKSSVKEEKKSDVLAASMPPLPTKRGGGGKGRAKKEKDEEKEKTKSAGGRSLKASESSSLVTGSLSIRTRRQLQQKVKQREEVGDEEEEEEEEEENEDAETEGGEEEVEPTPSPLPVVESGDLSGDVTTNTTRRGRSRVLLRSTRKRKAGAEGEAADSEDDNAGGSSGMEEQEVVIPTGRRKRAAPEASGGVRPASQTGEAPIEGPATRTRRKRNVA